MTVSELIDRLKTFDQNLTVMIESTSGEYYAEEATDAEQISGDNNDYVLIKHV